jgi:MYXO-CTERM domain-containing protein
MKSLFTLLATCTIASAASAATVWTTPAAVKVRPATQPPAGAPTSASISAAKNEFEAFHVVVTGQAAKVSMAIEGLSDGNGHVISGRDLVLYREALINVATPSGGDGAAGVWPDALVPDVDPIAGEKRNAFPFDVPAGESRAVLVDVHVPAGYPAGVYTGVLHVTGGITADVPVKLMVWDFELPSTATLRSSFTMAWNGPCLGHGDGNCSNADAEQRLRSRYLQAALDNRLTISTPALGGPVNASGGEDWSAFDQYVGPFLDGTAPTRLQGAKLTAVQIVSNTGYGNAAQTRAWSKHFDAKGWKGAATLFNYICDEPPLTCAWNDIAGRIAESRTGDPSVPTLVTTTTREAKQHGVGGIDLFVPVVNWVEDRPGANYAGSQRAEYGPNTWWYQSCMSFGCAGVGGIYEATTLTSLSGWPSYAIDTDGTRNRAMEWMSFTYDMTGELYYETTMAFFTGDPWTNQYNFGGTGDGTLFYPGTAARIGGQTEIPVESLRMKGIRDGMEDYELLAYAKKLGLEAQAKQIAAGVFPKTYLATAPVQALDEARAQLAQLILHALGKDQVVPEPTPTPVPAPVPPTGNPGTTTGGNQSPVTQPGIVPDAHSSLLGGGGCSTSGPQAAWLGLPLVALLFLRRRRA